MKKITLGSVALSLGLSMLLGCGGQALAASSPSALPVPKYPLDVDAVSKALDECDLSFDIKEGNLVGKKLPERSLLNLYLPGTDKFFSIGISSAQVDGERLVSFTLPPLHMRNALPAEESKDIIVLSTVLFGGFENENVVYDKFTEEYGKKNTTMVKHAPPAKVQANPVREAESTWKNNVGGATCQIRLDRAKLGEPQEYLSIITIASDWETFFPAKTDEVKSPKTSDKK